LHVLTGRRTGQTGVSSVCLLADLHTFTVLPAHALADRNSCGCFGHHSLATGQRRHMEGPVELKAVQSRPRPNQFQRLHIPICSGRRQHCVDDHHRADAGVLLGWSWGLLAATATATLPLTPSHSRRQQMFCMVPQCTDNQDRHPFHTTRRAFANSNQLSVCASFLQPACSLQPTFVHNPLAQHITVAGLLKGQGGGGGKHPTLGHHSLCVASKTRRAPSPTGSSTFPVTLK
jgi:hypothetical protein